MKEKILNTKNFKWIILFMCLLMFFAILEDVFEKQIMKLDILGYGLISNMISNNITPVTIVITNFGGAITLIGLTIIFLLVIKNKKISLSILFNLGIATFLNILLKNIIQRPRPEGFRLISETGYSFPSGHSMISMAYYGYLIYLIFKFVKNKKLKTFLIIILGVLILSIGISRIYLGVHYTSDVIAGFVLSISYLIIYTSIIKKYIIEREEENDTKNKKIN